MCERTRRRHNLSNRFLYSIFHIFLRYVADLDVVEVLVLLSLLVFEVALLLEALHSAAGRVAAVLQGAAPERESNQCNNHRK